MATFDKIALFVFFDSIEQDLVKVVQENSAVIDCDILTAEEREKASRNLSQRIQNSSSALDEDLLSGLDIGEKFNVVMRHKSVLSRDQVKYYTSLAKSFGSIISVRNSVMHGRPLTIDELAFAFAFVRQLLKDGNYWKVLSENFRKYSEDPNSIVGNSIRFIESSEESTLEAYNNLPTPDYDDTGFFPRKKLQEDLTKKIKGRHPVITVLGDGGDGKTALTLQTLYSLLRENDHGFDAIIWVSAKSNRLSVSEIERIETEITSSYAAFGEVVQLFESASSDPEARLRSLMEENTILLVVDNLETIADEKLRSFAEDVPGNSKLILTSRIPLGGDLSVNVGPFTSAEARKFLRHLAKVYSISILQKKDDDAIARYTNRLHNKPLLLKWFSLGVSKGIDPDKIVSNPEMALRFCLENVFDALTKNARETVSVMSVMPRAVSLSVLEHVSERETFSLESALAELIRYSIVEQIYDHSYETNFQIRPFAKAYLVRVLKKISTDTDQVLTRFRQIEGIYQTERGAESHNKFNPQQYTVRSKSEALAVMKLRRAVALAREENFVSAFRIISDVSVLNSGYFEVYRAEAFIATLAQDLARAKDAYERAVELSENQPRLHFLFGTFMLKSYEDFDGATEQFEKATRIAPDFVMAYIEGARAKMFKLEFEGATSLINGAKKCNAISAKENRIICDTELNIWFRHIESIYQGLIDGSMRYALSGFKGFVDRIDADVVDERIATHIEKYHSKLASLSVRECSEELAAALRSVDSLMGVLGLPSIENSQQGSAVKSERLKGKASRTGRNLAFVLLTNEIDESVALYPRVHADTDTWNEICQGRTVTYSTKAGAKGPMAYDVILV